MFGVPPGGGAVDAEFPSLLFESPSPAGPPVPLPAGWLAALLSAIGLALLAEGADEGLPLVASSFA